MNWILLIVLIVVTNLPYKRSHFPQGSWIETRAITLAFVVGILILLIGIQPYLIPVIITPQLAILFSILTIIWYALPAVVRRYGSYPTQALHNKPKRFLIRMQYPVWTLKYVEILFQQVCFVYLFFVLLNGTHYRDSALVWFTVLVSGVHLVNFRYRERFIAGLFFLLSIPMAILFGHLLFEGYVIMTIMIHLLFYMLFYGSYWFRGRKI